METIIATSHKPLLFAVSTCDRTGAQTTQLYIGTSMLHGTVRLIVRGYLCTAYVAFIFSLNLEAGSGTLHALIEVAT